MVTPATAFAKVKIPDQRALIHFANGKETLVIDTAFKGDGTNFAWIVPFPSVPTVEPATTGLFTTLQFIFQPKVVNDASAFYWPAIIFGALCFFTIWSRRRGESWLPILFVILFLILISGLLLPALGGAGLNISTSNVNVIERKRVGVYETATISSTNGDALLAWLTQNGFTTPTNAVPAIHAYAAEGWCFVASKIRLDATSTEPVRPHPLSFTFKTEKPVYPLRLTGIGNDKIQIDLYIFGPGRASVPHFEIERCAAPSYPIEDDRSIHRSVDQMRIRHPLLRKLVEGDPVVTKLSGVLSSEQMGKDSYISWSPLLEKRLAFYTKQGAAEEAANYCVPVLVLALLLYYAYGESEASWVKGFCRNCKIAALSAILAWPVIYFSLPKTQAVLVKMPVLYNLVLHKGTIPRCLTEIISQTQRTSGTSFVPDLDWIRKQLIETSPLRESLDVKMQKNIFSGVPWHEEDSPGNFTLRETASGIDYNWYDIDGSEHTVNIYPYVK